MGASFTIVSAAFGLLHGDPAFHLRDGWRTDYARPAVVPYPEDNPWSAEKSQLGATLFFDPALSGSQAMSCASCHLPGTAWADNLPRSVGDQHQVMDLRSPTLLNIAWSPLLGWDGKFASIEAVSFAAISGSSNMNLPVQDALDRLSASPAYLHGFDAAFGPGAITQAWVEQALATYERGIVSADGPFDRWVAGDEGAVSTAVKRGFALFEGSAGCSGCHSGWAFTDNSFHDIGSATGDDIGRGRLFPSSVALRYAFKTPTLRDVAVRAPYMHDGSRGTLDAVLDLYGQGGIARPSRSHQIKPLGLTPAERSDLISFLEVLTSDPQRPGRPPPLR